MEVVVYVEHFLQIIQSTRDPQWAEDAHWEPEISVFVQLCKNDQVLKLLLNTCIQYFAQNEKQKQQNQPYL